MSGGGPGATAIIAEGASVERPNDPIISSPLLARAARLGILAWSMVGIAVLVYLFGRYVLYPIRIIFPPLILALIIVYLLNPVVSFLERRGVRRGLKDDPDRVQHEIGRAHV